MTKASLYKSLPIKKCDLRIKRQSLIQQTLSPQAACSKAEGLVDKRKQTFPDWHTHCNSPVLPVKLHAFPEPHSDTMFS